MCNGFGPERVRNVSLGLNQIPIRKRWESMARGTRCKHVLWSVTCVHILSHIGTSQKVHIVRERLTAWKTSGRQRPVGTCWRPRRRPLIAALDPAEDAGKLVARFKYLELLLTAFGRAEDYARMSSTSALSWHERSMNRKELSFVQSGQQNEFNRKYSQEVGLGERAARGALAMRQLPGVTLPTGGGGFLLLPFASSECFAYGSPLSKSWKSENQNVQHFRFKKAKFSPYLAVSAPMVLGKDSFQNLQHFRDLRNHTAEFSPFGRKNYVCQTSLNLPKL